MRTNSLAVQLNAMVAVHQVQSRARASGALPTDAKVIADLKGGVAREADSLVMSHALEGVFDTFAAHPPEKQVEDIRSVAQLLLQQVPNLAMGLLQQRGAATLGWDSSAGKGDYEDVTVRLALRNALPFLSGESREKIQLLLDGPALARNLRA